MTLHKQYRYVVWFVNVSLEHGMRKDSVDLNHGLKVDQKYEKVRYKTMIRRLAVVMCV